MCYKTHTVKEWGNSRECFFCFVLYIFVNVHLRLWLCFFNDLSFLISLFYILTRQETIPRHYNTNQYTFSSFYLFQQNRVVNIKNNIIIKDYPISLSDIYEINISILFHFWLSLHASHTSMPVFGVIKRIQY